MQFIQGTIRVLARCQNNAHKTGPVTDQYKSEDGVTPSELGGKLQPENCGYAFALCGNATVSLVHGSRRWGQMGGNPMKHTLNNSGAMT